MSNCTTIQKMGTQLALFLFFTLIFTLFGIAQKRTPIHKTNYWTMFTNGDGLCRDTSTNELIDGSVYLASVSGKPLIEFNLKEGLRHGIQLTWYQNGELESEYHYHLGVEQGVRKIWHPNGVAHHIDHIKNGKPHGSLKSWYDNGQLEQEFHYFEGKQDGNQRSWSKNGGLKYEQNFYRGEIHGIQKFWHKNGQLSNIEEFENGEFIGISCWDAQGNVMFCGLHKFK